jgi:nucleoside-triphosphatase THEP1
MEDTNILDSLCGNQSKYQEIIEWIKQQLELPVSTLTFNNFIFVSGDVGIGKSTSIQKICDALNLHMVHITTSNCSSSEELNDLLIKHCSASMIQVLLNDKRRRIIIIDEFDSMMTMDRTMNLAIYNILNGNYPCNKTGKTAKAPSIKSIKMTPIICIASTDIMKRIGNIKKKCLNIQLEKPSCPDIQKLLIQIIPSIDVEKAETAARAANGNISQALENVKLDEKNAASYASIDDNVNINVLYSTKFERERLRKIILTDSWLIPLKYHENLIDELDRRKVSAKNAKEFYKSFMSQLIEYDVLMHNNAVDQAIDIFSSALYPLTTLSLKQNTVSNMENFTKILSYLSLQKKNTKNAYTGLYQIGSYHTNITGRNNMFFN